MTKRALLSIGLSALVVAGTIAGQGYAADRDAAKAAATDARAATKALGRRDGDAAIRFAEEAVALQPRAAGYRMLLGQGYLQAGRFASARAAFADVLLLDPGNGRAGLNLALAQIATGDWQAARATLDTHAGAIAPADRGLALALAGDPAGAVALLMEAARTPGATAKVRQNLALALALAGQWQAARAAASADMSPADVDARMAQWAAFAQPSAASEQVATLLGVRAAADPGQPVALALAEPAAPIASGRIAVAAPVTPPDADADPVGAPPPMMAALVFGPRREVVQPLPVPLIAPSRVPARLALASASITPRVQPIRVLRFASAATPVEGPVRRLDTEGAPGMLKASLPAAAPAAPGGWYVQLGAFENAAVARDAWGRIGRRHGIADRVPNGATVKAAAGSFYRLSVGGFARGDADRLCRRLRTQGGACFVRAGAGDRGVAWNGAGKVQVAAGRSASPA